MAAMPRLSVKNDWFIAAAMIVPRPFFRMESIDGSR